MVSGSVIYIPSLKKAGKGVQQLLGAINGHTHTHTHTHTHIQLISYLLLIFKNMEIGQKVKGMTHRCRAKIYI
jgi:hypothetical protein